MKVATAKTASTVLLSVAALCLATPALADGAFPDELSVYLPPNDPAKIMLGTNFGLVVSQDTGQSWRFICELFITGSGADIVNYYKIGSDGAIIAITFVNLWRSSDGGCSWTRATGSVASLDVLDAFIDPNDPTFVIAIASSPSGAGSGLYPSHDGGLTFGDALYPTTDLLTGIEISRKNGNIIYATRNHAANSGGQGGAFLMRSDDRGKTWSEQQLQVSSSTVPRIAGVDPENPDIVYLRLLALADSRDQIANYNYPAKTMTVAATLSGGNVFFTSFLRANDGTLYAGTSSSDLYVQPAGSSGFTKRVGPRARCLGQRIGESRTYACGDGFLDGYNLGYSDDGANTFKPMMKFTDIAGPLTCPSVQNFCAIQYQNLMQTLNGNDAGPTGSDGGTQLRPGASGSCATGDAGIGALLALPLLLWRRRFAR